ncbi:MULTISPECIES: nitrite reductase small subunit NirD [Hydrogenophilus]|jgi:nitrite reductase (NADH) small subunit|uniref:Assimilatory nitrite reductase small subunit n=1 Tax=Hydrogenophilus thermoluteolus TaxID=297 RepID=A0A2Z6DX41_HYDTE|nr:MULTISPECIES: nitrite reductase small subunit NirD [Hydrogenophilus]MBW7656817.1 nitrite reductase small subunit NirD [Hydrogenophilus thermoluteolus]BBD77017.1 assimilatory nitrite reductase small subunit [Hydrogenophilus thermoluteolus]HNQ49759.1 nitrite reductase small subunit NirD [Hydrogenophilus thermoluteolus]
MNLWKKVCPLEQIPRLGAMRIETPKGAIALFRTRDDQLFAVTDRCPHKGGPLSQGIVAGHEVTCPLHGWRIDLTTGEAVSPDKGCVTRYPTKVEEEWVWIAL